MANRPRLMGASLSDPIYEALRADILSGRLAGGVPLRQDVIASEHGVSKIPVREALRQLEMEGLVEFRPRRGAIVRQLTEKEVLELIDIRLALECRALELAVPNMIDSDFTVAGEILEEYEAEPSRERWSDLNLRFHHCLYEPCGNLRLLAMISEIEGRMGLFMRLKVTEASGLERPMREHRAILAACRRGAPKEAVGLMRQHIETTQKEVAASIRRASIRSVTDGA